jgi:orotidine-5'-phosphate decarboxylase
VPQRFIDRLDRILKARDSLVCVGLDPDPALFPKPIRALPARRRLDRFLDGVVDATAPHAAAFKMQLATYLAYGEVGIRTLSRLTRRIGSTRLRILDLKANDIPNIVRFYRDAAFREMGFDAITLTPWLGWETLEPFRTDARHGVFVVAHSSNPGAVDFQEIPTPRGPLWLAVIGETFSDAFRLARASLGNRVPILVPGVGAQGGSLATAVREGVDADGRALLVSASRSVLYASSGKDWKSAAGQEAARLRTQINQLRSGLRTG